MVNKEIGSEFENCSNDKFLTKSTLSNYIKGNYLTFRSGRDVLRFLANSLKKKSILFPSISCDSMLQPFIDSGYNIIYYNLDKDFVVDIEDLSQKIKLCDIFLYHNYFGVKCISEVFLTKLKKDNNNVTFIYDATHDFHTLDDLSWDFKVISIRKWFSIPEGGLLIPNDVSLFTTEHSSLFNDIDYVNYRKSAASLKSEYIKYRSIQKHTFLERYQRANEKLEIDKNVYRMSDFSLDILNKIDFESMLKKRAVNYNRLFSLFASDDLLKKYLFTNSFNSMIYLPLCVENRDYIQVELAKNGIYCPVLWINKITSIEYTTTQKNIENCNLCLPCDHRYDVIDMEHIYNVFKKIVGTLK